MIKYEINASVIFAEVKRLVKNVNAELADPETLAEYKAGSKDESIKDRYQPLLEDVSAELLEQHAYALTVGDAFESAWQSVYFYSVIYYELVTGAIELIGLRNTDIESSAAIIELLGTIDKQMYEMNDIADLGGLRSYISRKDNTFHNKPVLQDKVNGFLLLEAGLYYVNPSKKIDLYQDNDVLAYISQSVIQTATISDLPPGTELNSMTGEISVIDKTVLQEGIYTFNLETVDSIGSSSSNIITLQIGEEVFAQYTLNPSKMAMDYSDGDILGTVLDPDGNAVTAAYMAAGELPPGIFLNNDTGTILVGKADMLIPGGYGMLIRTTDALRRITDHTLGIEIFANTITTYDIATAKPLVEYKDGEVLALPIVKEGITIASTEVSGLPEGVSFNSVTGKLSVEDASALQTGTYTVVINVTDADGFENTSTLSITIGKPVDVEATYSISPTKALSDYEDGDTLAIPVDTNGPIVKALFISGQMPPGTIMNRFSGEILVSDTTRLIPGNYTAIINTIDISAGITEHEITIPIGAEAVYAIKRGRNVRSYVDTEIIAQAFDPRGTITNATVTSGTLPVGLALSTNGDIVVTNNTILVAGTTTVTIRTTTEDGDISDSILTFVFLPDAHAVYTVNPAKNRDAYEKGDIIATVSDADGSIVNAIVTKGFLPRGLKMESATGTISVDDPADLLGGTYTEIYITTTDETGGKTTCNITITIIKDIESVYTVNPAKEQSLYNNGDVLAFITDEDAIIISAVLNKGELPLGVSLNTTTGEINVIDKTKLRKGTYDLVIETVDEVLGNTINNITLVIKANPVPDSETVYSVAAPKPLGNYVNNDVLATASDADGPIVTAVITSGSLPPGTELLPNGTIKVVNKDLLAIGKYPLTILTTDSQGNSTSNTIEILIGNEAIYQYIRTVVNIEGTTNGDLLAHPVDPRGPITAAVVQSGSLPAGVALSATNGDLTVSNKSALVANSYTFTVRTTSSGGITDVIVAIQFINDTEAVYTINPPKNRDNYAAGDVIASATDPDGAIVAATVTGGSLPVGMVLAANGTISVENPAILLGGIYTDISILTTDNTGGKTTSTLTLVVKTDKESVYKVNPANYANRYNNGDILAYASDDDGPIVKAQIKQGILPFGCSFNTITGEIKVADKTQVREGNYTLIIDTWDNTGGFTENTITIVINQRIDNEAICTIAPPKNVDAYVNGDLLVAINDPDSTIVSAILIGGALAPGTTLNADGSITVTNKSLLVAGSYSMMIRTTDSYGETTDLSITITMLADHECTYSYAPVKKFNLYVNAEVLATPVDEDGIIISAVILSGTLAAGLTLESNGKIVVSNSSLLVAGTSSITVKLTDATGGTSSAALSIVLGTDSVAVYSVSPARYKHCYRNGDTLAVATDPDGPITASLITSGTLPAGTSLANNSRITVTTRNSLVGGTNTIGVRTTDSSSGITNSTITLVIKPISDRVLFCSHVELRILDLATIHADILTSTDTINVALFDLSLALFQRYSAGLTVTAFVNDLKNGLKDATIKSDITSMTAPTSEAIRQRKIEIAALSAGPARDRAIADLMFYTDLYNEQVVMAIELAGLRNSDLLSAILFPSADLNVMFETVRTQLLAVSTSIPELSFLKENINDRAGSLFSGKVNLILKITGLNSALTL